MKSRDQELIAEAYAKVLREDESLDQWHKAQTDKEAALDKKEAYKDNLLRREEDPMDELELERQFFEILGDLKYNKPELFDMFIKRLEDKGFRNQMKSLAGVSL